MLKYKLHFLAGFAGLFAAYFVSGLVSYLLVPDVAIPHAAVAVNHAVSEQAQLASSVVDRNIFGVDANLPADVLEALAATNAGGVGLGGSAQPGEAGYNPQLPFSGKLTGLFLDQSGELGIAILVVGDKDVFVLRKGQKVDPYELVELSISAAQINYYGKPFTLEIEGNTATTSRARPATTTAQPETVSGGTEQITITRAELKSELSDINKVLTSLLVVPLNQNGEFMGYRISRLNEDSPIRALGLTRGDVINRINGEELTNPEILFNMLSSVDDLSAVSLDITRGKEKKTLFVEIQ